MSYGRTSDSYAVRFVNDDGLLPGVTFVTACEIIGETIAALKDRGIVARVTAADNAERQANIDAVLFAIAKGEKVPGINARPIVTGKKGQTYTARETAAAIVTARGLIAKHGKAKQAKRYAERVGDECDRVNGLGRAGGNVIGWSDSTRGPSVAISQATDAEIIAAHRARAARSGENAPQAVHARRVAAEAAEAAAAAPKRSGRKPRGAAAPAVTPAPTTGARKRPSQASKAPAAGSVAKRPTRARKGA